MLIHISTMSRSWRITLWVYLAVAAVFELMALWSAYGGGGFERHHTLVDLAVIAAIHLAAALLWPVVLVVQALQYFGFLPYPITF